MTKKHFIALADKVKYANRNQMDGGRTVDGGNQVFGPMAIKFLADFCEDQSDSFKRQRWIDLHRR